MSDPNNKVIMKEEVGFSLPQVVNKVVKKVPKILVNVPKGVSLFSKLGNPKFDCLGLWADSI